MNKIPISIEKIIETLSSQETLVCFFSPLTGGYNKITFKLVNGELLQYVEEYDLWISSQLLFTSFQIFGRQPEFFIEANPGSL